MKLLKLKSGLYKRILGMFGAAGFLVTFQACYGTPQNFLTVQGNVKDVDTEEGVSNLQVSIYSDQDSITVLTDESGNFSQSLIAESDINVKILDIDGEENGTYTEFDTTLNNTDHILDINLQKKL